MRQTFLVRMNDKGYLVVNAVLRRHYPMIIHAIIQLMCRNVSPVQFISERVPYSHVYGTATYVPTLEMRGRVSFVASLGKISHAYAILVGHLQ